MAANEIAKEALLVEGVDNEKISIIPQSVDTRVFRPKIKSDEGKLVSLRKRIGIRSDDFVVLGVGRMVWEKGWLDIIRAAAKLRQSKEIKFLLVGAGPELSAFSNFVKRERLRKSVLFAGSMPYRLMPDVYRLADVFVHASLPTRDWNEQFGGVLIEAMATGLPVIGTLSGGILTTVGSEGGLFVQLQNFSQISEAINTLYRNDRLRRKMGHRNIKHAVNIYDVEVVAQKLKRIWDNLL